jgi:multidrug transporter EmrE-like cation transporter
MKKYFFLFAPVLFSVAAQFLLKQAALKEWKSTAWLLTMGGSLVGYTLALALYSVAIRYFPVSLVSPVNGIAVMLLVIIGGTVFWDEPFGVRQMIGTILGVLSMLLMLI